MKIADFNYHLPEELIAQQPLAERDASRMLVLDRRQQKWIDKSFSALPEFFAEGDLLVINNTRVFPARLYGQRSSSGGRVEILLVREIGELTWEALVRPGGRLREGEIVSFPNSSLQARLINGPGGEMRQLRFNSAEMLERELNETGEMPLPPYIKRPQGTSADDRDRYQTIFARERGAIAAPTAGLHFTPKMITALKDRGIALAEITLHVGYGTFEPVRTENIEEHRVRPEQFEITTTVAETINAKRAAGGRLFAVGTTTTRALESAADENGIVNATRGEADLTITPGYRFRAVDALLTNFHLPGSSLLFLVSAFAGREFVLAAYHHAVEQRYRFYSYGDCMLII